MPADTSSACYVILSEAAKFECTLFEFFAVLASHIFAFSCTGLLLRFVLLETQKTPVDFSAVVSSESCDLNLAVVCVAVFVLEVLPELLTHFELAQEVAMDEVFSKDDWPTKAAQFILTSPKFPLCTSLVLFGSWFILTSESNKDLILNTVALTFVNNIDNTVYAMFVSRRLQRKITNTALVKGTRVRIEPPATYSTYFEGASLAERPSHTEFSYVGAGKGSYRIPQAAKYGAGGSVCSCLCFMFRYICLSRSALLIAMAVLVPWLLLRWHSDGQVF
ncbi:unnamed protein product [Symbiodinium pilosum]|uniref:Uncharacterized protein n=1 Tax=Symbiodinium pilosum TaxID=2952 RepID=A0A812YDZ9_SYMPI|nr:unnamed protein product [Symbiodinium pilosum]